METTEGTGASVRLRRRALDVAERLWGIRWEVISVMWAGIGLGVWTACFAKLVSGVGE